MAATSTTPTRTAVLARPKARAIFAVLVVVMSLLAAISRGDGEQASSKILSVQAGKIDAGGSHTCAIHDDATVRCWGVGVDGRLGYADTATIGDDEHPGPVGPVDLGAGRTAIAITAGGIHTCALLDDATVRCWGNGGNGRLGYADTANIGDTETPGSVGPVNLGVGRTAVAITAGSFHTCALLDDATVRCWGEATNGQLGYANSTTIGDDETPGSVGPVSLGTGRTAVAITAGSFHTCALLDDATVRCWGNGANGRLGYANTTGIGDNETPGSVGPVDLGAGLTALAITAGNAHTCALLDNATVRCWGEGDFGRLGYVNTTDIGDTETPGSVGPVSLGAGRTAVAITAGNFHTCALLDNATVRCWGEGDFGRLGYVNTTDIGDTQTPGSVGPVSLGAGRTGVAIAAGGSHTCALLDDDTVRCWGLGLNGQLGYTNTNDIGDTETPGSVGPVGLGPAPANADLVTAGLQHTCALLDDDAVRCWGLGGDGRLGYANTTTIGDTETPGSVGPVNLGAGRMAVAVTAGDAHTCALLDDATVRCWGLGDFGQLGYANTTTIGDTETPESVGPINLGAGRTAVAITAGGVHTCALLDDATVRCWGEGNFGQLGYANTTTIGDDETPGSIGPVNLGVGRTAVAITAGIVHTCALLDDATVRCWGLGDSGQLGYANTNTIGDDEHPGPVGPVNLGNGRTAVTITAGLEHTCAVLDDATVRCWGAGGVGQLGYANSDNIGDDELPGSVGPVDLGAGRTAVAITAGDEHTCAVLDNATVRCWGAGGSGRLGYANPTDIGDTEAPGSVGPVNLGAGRTAVAVTAGGQHTCALLDDATVRCWGAGFNGQLGYANTTIIGDTEQPGSAGPVFPRHDTFANPRPLGSASGTASGSTSGGSGQSGEQTNVPASVPIQSVWATWTAPFTGVATFNTCTPGFDTTLGAYAGAAVGSLTKIDANDDGCFSGDGSLVKFGVIAGNTYRLSVDGATSTTGTFTLAWSLEPGFALTTASVGSGTITGEGIDCGTDCSEGFKTGDVVLLSATTSAGHTFAGWSGACAGTGTCTVTMSQARSVTATFADLGLGCTILGTGASDVLVGTSAPDVICGFGGNDFLKGADGADVLLPGGGNDVIDGGGSSGDVVSYADVSGPVVVNMVAKTVSGAGSDTMSGVESAVGTTGADTLIGNSNRNTLSGGLGADILRGSGGDDTILPGSVVDTEIDGGTGAADLVSYAGLPGPGGVSIDLSSGSDAIVNIERVTGTEQADTLIGDGATNVLSGLGGADTLSGAGGNDTLLPGAGADPSLDGGSGTDLLSYQGLGTAVVVDLSSGSDPVVGVENVTGGNGADTLTGDGGANTLVGGKGPDSIAGGAGNDVLQPGAGSDPVVDGSSGIDVVSYADIAVGGVSVNLVTASAVATPGGEAGTDTLAGIERVRGTPQGDVLVGNDGVNVLTGSGGADVLQGAGGADELLPGTGNDTTVNGGSGTDTVIYDDITSGGVSVDLGAGTTGDGAGSDGLVSIERVRGSNQDDDLTGSSVVNQVFGLDGDDDLDVADGNAGDLADGGLGDDTCAADAGDTQVSCA